MVSSAELRYGGEWLDLFIASAVTLILIVVLGFISSGIVCAWAVLGLVIVMVISLYANSQTKKRAKRVDRESFPELAQDVSTAAHRLSMMYEPPVFIEDSQELNAYARGIISPIIILNQRLVGRMDEDELLFVIGHEMGHIKLSHTPLKTIFESGMHRVPFIIYLPMLAFRLFFLRGRMSRSMEHSADRAGLYACRSIEAAVRAQLKFERDHVADREVRAAIDNKEGESGDVKLGDLLRTHPKEAKRIRKMVEYSKGSGVGWTKD